MTHLLSLLCAYSVAWLCSALLHASDSDIGGMSLLLALMITTTTLPAIWFERLRTGESGPRA